VWTHATFHGSGPSTLRKVRGFIVPAPTCKSWSTESATDVGEANDRRVGGLVAPTSVLLHCMTAHPTEAQYSWRRWMACWNVSAEAEAAVPLPDEEGEGERAGTPSESDRATAGADRRRRRRGRRPERRVGAGSGE
jgi:hypothetical protein